MVENGGNGQHEPEAGKAVQQIAQLTERSGELKDQKAESAVTRRSRYPDFEGGKNGFSLDQMIVYQKIGEKDAWRS